MTHEGTYTATRREQDLIRHKVLVKLVMEILKIDEMIGC